MKILTYALVALIAFMLGVSYAFWYESKVPERQYEKTKQELIDTLVAHGWPRDKIK